MMRSNLLFDVDKKRRRMITVHIGFNPEKTGIYGYIKDV